MTRHEPLGRDEIVSRVVRVLALIKELDSAQISLEMDLYEKDPGDASVEGEAADDANNLQLDSLDALELTLALENQFHLGIPEEIDYSRFRRVIDVVDFIEQLIEAGNAAS